MPAVEDSVPENGRIVDVGTDWDACLVRLARGGTEDGGAQ
jgi:hypothetical protein